MQRKKSSKAFVDFGEGIGMEDFICCRDHKAAADFR
jgi:hypothetical protein